MKETWGIFPLPYRSKEQKKRLKLSTMPSLSYFHKNPKLYCPKCGAGLYLRREAKKIAEGEPEI